jgi:hypothetical protein
MPKHRYLLIGKCPLESIMVPAKLFLLILLLPLPHCRSRRTKWNGACVPKWWYDLPGEVCVVKVSQLCCVDLRRGVISLYKKRLVHDDTSRVASITSLMVRKLAKHADSNPKQCSRGRKTTLV